MANEKNQILGKTQNQNGQTVEVLYQRMGDRWFAFSLINDEIFVGSITPEELGHAEATKGRTRVHRKSGNS